MKNTNAPKNLASALHIKPAQLAALLQVGHSYLENGRYEEAEDIFEGVEILDPQNPYPPAALGAISQRRGDNQQALEHYNRALELFPSNLHCLVNRGEAYLNLGKFKEAAADWKEALAMDPQGKDPASNRARILASLTMEGLQLASEKGVKAVMEAKRRLDEQLSL